MEKISLSQEWKRGVMYGDELVCV